MNGPAQGHTSCRLAGSLLLEALPGPSADYKRVVHVLGTPHVVGPHVVRGRTGTYTIDIHGVDWTAYHTVLPEPYSLGNSSGLTDLPHLSTHARNP